MLMTCVMRQVRTLGSQVRLDARTKLLNPKWYASLFCLAWQAFKVSAYALITGVKCRTGFYLFATSPKLGKVLLPYV